MVLALIACSWGVDIVSPARADETYSSAGASALRSWIAADSHIHSTGCEAPYRSPAELHNLMLDAGLNVADVLVWGASWSLDHDLFSGADDAVSTPSNILRYDLEISGFPAMQLGHLVALGLSSIDFSDAPFSSPLSGVPIVDWALAQDPLPLIGADHGQWWYSANEFPEPGKPGTCCIPFEFPVHVARGRATFLSIQQFGLGAWALWSRLQNSGFRVPIMAGSDYPCMGENNEVGSVRTYVEIDEPFTFDSYLDAIRAGRTVAASSQYGWMTLTANGMGLGEEIQLGGGEPLFVTLETDVPQPSNVWIRYNGEFVYLEYAQAGVGSANIEFVPTKSGWLVAQANEAWTSPIYVVVDGLPIRASADDACFMARYVEYLKSLVNNGGFNDLGEDHDAVIAAYEEARDVFLLRFAEAGGTSCETIRTAAPGTFCVAGNSDGGDWSWQVDAFSPIVVPAPPASSNLSGLRDAFVTSINGAPAPLGDNLSASNGPGWYCFTVTSNTSFQLFAGPASLPLDCLVSGNPAGCFFNARIFEREFMPTSVPSMKLSMLVLMGGLLLAVTFLLLLPTTPRHPPGSDTSAR